ncbi:hypothetical protein MVES1_003728 [Malassezia vespertilionis]|uniref:uncharacterized protein n=1 Tax=Malassezia vespertilionis TaxID=2020962 RepID=UPI0024B06DF3|nr:uncharacterized protein MVES1_003728 [Malassezia vespertilionis]WFD08356.1 hypothetical protein MVES1_003728 [Malassezia vespertilionis]
MLHDDMLANAALVLLLVLLLRSGISTVLILIALVSLLLCNPHVRTFLELAAPGHLASDKSTERDAKRVDALRAYLVDLADQKPKDMPQLQGLMDLDGVPGVVRTELEKTFGLFRRDYLQYWYDPISFGDPAFPDDAIHSLVHLVAQICMRFAQYQRMHIASELSLTALGVLVAALRSRRENAAGAADVHADVHACGAGLWESSEARIASLRSSISSLLLQNLPKEDSRSPALVVMLTDILAKQLWSVLQTQSDPDMVNQYIVKYGASSGDSAIAAVLVGGAPPSAAHAAEQSVSLLDAACASDDTPVLHMSTLDASGAVTTPANATATQQTAAALHDASGADREASTELSTPALCDEGRGEGREEPHISTDDAPSATTEANASSASLALPLDAPAPSYAVRKPRTKDVEEILKARNPHIMDPFEAYMQRLDASDQHRNAEGIALLQLYTNLNALHDTVELGKSTPQLFESDARSVLEAAYEALPVRAVPPPLPDAQVRTAIHEALQMRLGTPNALRPVGAAVVARLQQLWDMYQSSTRRKSIPPDTQHLGLAYEPRRPASQNSARHPSPRPEAPTQDTIPVTISVMDVSPDAGAETVDVRTLQLLISIESAEDAATGSGGYALLRTWPQLEQLQKELERMYAQRPADTVLVERPPSLPSLRRKSSAQACAAIQAYLAALLSPERGQLAWFSTTQAVQRFIDKTRADDASVPTKRTPTLMTSLGGMSRSFASGVVGAAGTARKGFEQISAAAPAQRALFGAKEPELPKPALPARKPMSALPLPRRPESPETNPMRPASPNKLSMAEPELALDACSLSSHDIDALLTAVFAAAHEAFNLQGSWTFRRGLLRVLEQVVRTTYSTSVMGTLVYFAAMLTPSALAAWVAYLRDAIWPNGVYSQEETPPRTAEQRRVTAVEARNVVLSYTPTQAAYALGIGGKQTCMDAMATVHDVLTDPAVSLDLHLTLLLRVLDLGKGVASGNRV